MKASLTQVDAENRAASIEAGIHYIMFLNLKHGLDYAGTAQINFHLKNTDHVFLDFVGNEVSHIHLNHHEFSKEEVQQAHKDNRITLPASHLKIGANQVTVHFENSYSNDGNGLHSFTDTDGKQYIYTQTEPFNANRIFPVFDQPDLKGKLVFKAVCQEEWTVIAINPGIVKDFEHYLSDENHTCGFQKMIQKHYKIDQKETKQKIYEFESTDPLSTYLYGFAVGPFKSIELPIEKSVDGIPMSIFVRDSLFTYAKEQAHTIFSFAVEGIKFYNDFFKIKFPFKKFDFVFCPEYTVGAMEYPGVITFNDLYVFREQPSIVQISRRGATILHELAHMWFGNLVTMKWWNDLWLNESFAEFICYVCQCQITSKLDFEVTDGWTAFLQSKFWGYEEDQMQTTHPIFCEVVTTSKADSIFDGITYSKGASVLKQLFYLIGEKQFSENIACYFEKYKWTNATFDQFIEEMNKQKIVDVESKVELSILDWKKSWIETAGLNVIEVHWKPDQIGASKLVLNQSGALKEHPTLRHHKLKLAFLDSNAKVALVKEVFLQDKEKTEVNFENAGFHAVIPNYEDWAYIKISLDDHSLKFLTENFDKIESNVTKILVIRSMLEAVLDAKFKGDQFTKTLIDKFFFDVKIKNVSLFKTVFSMLSEAIWGCLPKAEKIKCRSLVFEKLEKILVHQDTKELRKFIVKEMITYAYSDVHIEVIRKLLDEQLEKTDRLLGFDDMWRILVKVFASKSILEAKKQEYLAQLNKLDNSETANNTKLSIETMVANADQRKTIWEKIIAKDQKYSFIELRSCIGGFFNVFVDDALKQPYYESFYHELPRIVAEYSKSHASAFLNIAPDTQEDKLVISHLEEIEKKLPETNEFFKIELKKMVDVRKREEKIFALFV